MEQLALEWIARYGYVGIFSLLAFGIVGLPVPDEWLMTFTGYLIFRNTLSFIPAWVAAFAGSACGITVSYTLGRIFDTYILVKYGWLFHLTPERLARVHSWFERRGRWTLLIGYFIPGVRHFTGYVAGMSELSYPSFAMFAYTGALCWSGFFITLGYFLGEEWKRVTASFHQTRYIVIAIAVLAALGYAAYLVLRRKRLGTA